MPTHEQPFVDPEFMTVRQASRYLNVSIATLRRWDESGKLPSVRHPANGYRYYQRANLERYRLDYQVAEASSDKPSIFQSAETFIDANESLRQPQRAAHRLVRQHFATRTTHAIVQLPVGCGKTGVIATIPFGTARGRVLVITPNLTIRTVIAEALDIRSANCFWRKRGVLEAFTNGPFTAILDGPEANVHDCLESHFVVTNIQQLAGSADRWLSKFPRNFFDMILLDEGHHNVTASYRKVLDHFPDAKVVSLTATPFRGDQQQLAGEIIYRFPFTSAMASGFIKKITATNVVPSEIYFTYRGESQRHTVDEVMELREEAWYSRGVALSEECNVHVVDESVAKLEALRATGGTRHQIIAVACSVDHARQIRALYEQRGLRAQEIYSEMQDEQKATIIERLKRGNLDCIVQVLMLGEGFDHPPLSVAAIFRPFRSLAPYIQFIGRIMRVNVEGAPDDPNNHGYVISHVGLNNDAQWEDFRELDLADQELFRKWVREQSAVDGSSEGDGGARSRGRGPTMNVTREVLGDFVTNHVFMDANDDRVLDKFLETSVPGVGLTLAGLGVTRDALRQKLLAAQAPKTQPPAAPVPVPPQLARQTGRRRLAERARTESNRILSDVGISVKGYDLMKHFKGGRRVNFEIVVELLNRELNGSLGKPSGTRGDWSREQVIQGNRELDGIGNLIRDQIQKVLTE